MTEINHNRMIPLHIADQAVAACDAEIAKLREENARLKAEVERLTAFTTRTIIPNEELQAEVERLTKAGDAMAMTLQADYNGVPYEPFVVVNAIIYWRTAKEGKQP
jgi:hypothetical protein